MQCPLASGCWMSPKFVFLAVGGFGLALGVLSAFQPQRSIALYQGIMERFNWRVAPIDLAREVRNTRVLGAVLTALSFAVCSIAFSRF